jgi:hypothetical protein
MTSKKWLSASINGDFHQEEASTLAFIRGIVKNEPTLWKLNGGA